MKSLGSLFDGIGGFPLAAVRVGIKPVWASEIEKAPVLITRRHFPDMAHLGDITLLSGADIEPVDIITFGSPCQDFSVGGRRAGLRGGRSSLFMHAVRLIKEMRVATNGKCPARIVWENVPGVFATSGGGDFKTIIEEIAGIAEPGISISRPSGGWLAAGAVMGNCWSIAWRVLDAQYWGVPQRRRRVFIVADFGSRCAGEILFKPQGGPGDNPAFQKAGQGFAGSVETGVARNAVTYCIVGNTIDRTEKSGGNGLGVNEEVSYTLTAADRHAVMVPYIRGGFGAYAQGNIGSTIRAKEENRSGDLVVTPYAVRRLTPLECERLQGFPNYWTLYGHDGGLISDGQRYKVLGNSVAVPCVQFILDGMNSVI